MRHFLKRRLTDGVPQTQSLVWKGCRNGACDPCSCRHERSPRGVVKLTDVTEMLSRNYQRVTGMKLPKVDKHHGEIIFPDDTGGLRAAYDPAEDASVTHELCLANLTVKPRSGAGAPELELADSRRLLPV
jgi:hypothetical protein